MGKGEEHDRLVDIITLVAFGASDHQVVKGKKRLGMLDQDRAAGAASDVEITVPGDCGRRRRRQDDSAASIWALDNSGFGNGHSIASVSGDTTTGPVVGNLEYS